MIQLLRSNPSIAAPIVLERLREKDLEWRRSRTDKRREWRVIVAENHSRSLDHRSFYFKSEDHKRRAPRGLCRSFPNRFAHFTFL